MLSCLLLSFGLLLQMLSKATSVTCNIHCKCNCTDKRARQAAYPGWGPPVWRRSAPAWCRAAAGEQSGVLFTPYELVEARDTYSIRLYAAHIVARTRYERRDEGFLRLGRYFDENENKLQQTQPIVMRYPLQARSWCCSRAVGNAAYQYYAHSTINRVVLRGTRLWSCTLGMRKCVLLSFPVLATSTGATQSCAECDPSILLAETTAKGQGGVAGCCRRWARCSAKAPRKRNADRV